MTTSRNGLYIGDLTAKEPRYGHTGTHPTAIIAQTPTISIVYTAQLPTTTEMEKLNTTREVKRSAIARRFQAALGFPPDTKMIRATRSGTFLNSDVRPCCPPLESWYAGSPHVCGTQYVHWQDITIEEGPGSGRPDHLRVRRESQRCLKPSCYGAPLDLSGCVKFFHLCCRELGSVHDGYCGLWGSVQ